MASTSGSDHDYSLFVGDLAQEVQDQYLEMFFRSYFTSTKNAKVITDGATGRSKGYGFVRFTSEAERDRALKEMNGVFVGSRPIRVSLATARRPGEAPRGAPPGPPGGGYGHSHGQGHGQGHNQDYGGFGGPGPGPREPPGGGAAGESDHNNTTLFLGNLSPYVTEDELKSAFARFGDIVYTKIPPGKNCGFVQFTERRVAEYAMQEMQGQFVGSAPVRISWGKSSGRGAGGREGGREGGRDGGRDGGAYASAPGYGGYGGYGYDVAGYNSYAAYDPYGMAYSGYSDPYAAYYSASGYAAPHGGAAVAAGAGSTAGEGSKAAPVQIYDPLAPANVDKMNNVYIHRHMPVYTGAAMRLKLIG